MGEAVACKFGLTLLSNDIIQYQAVQLFETSNNQLLLVDRLALDTIDANAVMWL